MLQISDTIVAISTPPGRGGIGIVRLSGPESLSLTRKLLQKPDFQPEPNRVSLHRLYDPQTGEELDRALITYFRAPRSFTGEDVVELSCHGSPVLLLQIVDILLQLGARAADPGEFTLGALANGRLNLSQAEAIRDLIDAQTTAAARQAARQLSGELSTRLQPFKDSLLEIIVPLESSLEFVEDDLPDLAIEGISARLSDLIGEIEDLAATFRTGRLLKEGLRVTLIGRPNVGKSSIFNALLKQDRAIVTELPGTTRDSLSEMLNLDGIPVLLTDTAGMREATDRIERIGIERTKRAIADADLLIVVIDGSAPLTEEDREVLSQARENRHLIAVNKSDLEGFSLERVRESGIEIDAELIAVSARTGDGLEALRDEILRSFAGSEDSSGGFLITNARHYDLLRRASESLRSAQDLIKQRASEELVLVGLYDALRYLGEITGETTPEDILDQIFSTFCIGK